MVIPAKLYRWTAPWLGTTQRAPKRGSFFCLDCAVARHAALPDDCELRDGATAWTWLPLTSQQAAVFKWNRFIDNPAEARTHLSECVPEESAQTAGEQEGVEFIGAPGGYKIEFPDGNESRLRYPLSSPHLTPLHHTFARNFEFPLAGTWQTVRTTFVSAQRGLPATSPARPIPFLPFEEEGRKILLGNQLHRTSKQRALRTQLCRRSMRTQLRSKAFRQLWCQWQISAVVPLTLILSQACRSQPKSMCNVLVPFLSDISVMIREVFRESLEKDTDFRADR